MEIKFKETAVGCMECLNTQRRQQEQTLELKLSEGMPDAGRILGCWGQPVIRGKEWRTGSIGVTGGTMVWVLYAPEDGSAPRCMEGWMPYQLQWDIPDDTPDGIIRCDPRLRSMDARVASARKIMVRCTLSMGAEPICRCESAVYTPEGVPDDIQLLKNEYPLEVMVQAGEKAFQIDEDIVIPSNYPPVVKVVCYDVQPRITEQKVMAGRLVFRGNCRVRLLYTGEDGMLSTWEQEIPFAQYADLDSEQSNQAVADFSVVLSGMELDRLEDGKLLFQCSLIAQYGIFDRMMVTAVEDAYSPCRELELHLHTLDLPVRLEQRKDRITGTKSVPLSGRLVDMGMLWDHGTIHHDGDGVQCEMVWQNQILCYDDNGVLQSAAVRAAQDWSMPSDPDNRVVLGSSDSSTQIAFHEDAAEVTTDMTLDVSVFSQKGMRIVTGITCSEVQSAAQDRPSLILRRAGELPLWDIAKECGSTVEAIRQLNRLQQEPERDQMLLIPVY